MLATPDFSHSFIIECDASGTGIGQCYSKVNGQSHVLAKDPPVRPWLSLRMKKNWWTLVYHLSLRKTWNTHIFYYFWLSQICRVLFNCMQIFYFYCKPCGLCMKIEKSQYPRVPFDHYNKGFLFVMLLWYSSDPNKKEWVLTLLLWNNYFPYPYNKVPISLCHHDTVIALRIKDLRSV